MPDQSDKIPVTGPEAIEYALAHLNTDEMEQEARAQIKSGKKSSRAAAVKRLNILSGLKRNQQTPSDFIIHKVPVLPTKYRPFAAQGDTLLPGDENVLYKDALDIINAYKDEADMFGAKNAGKSRLAMYDAVKSLYGYGDAVKAKTRSKGIEGYLKKIVGKGSKFSMAQRRLFTKTQDNVGRSTIIVDPDLDMNHIGLPKDLAFPMYAPYIQRALKRKGFTDAEALRHTKDRSEEATRALKEVMKEKPVLYSRSPAWFEFNLQGAFPVLTEGAAISMPPAVMKGLAGDFDGDQQIGRGYILVNLAELEASDPELCHNMQKRTCIKTNPVIISSTSQDDNNTMISNNNKAIVRKDNMVLAVDFADFPHGKLSNVRKDAEYDIEFYEVPDGIYVPAYNEADHSVQWRKVAYWSIHRGKKVEIVRLSDGSEIFTDNDPRAVYGIAADAENLTPQRFTPTEAAKRHVMVPKCAEFIPSAVEDKPLFYDFETNSLSDTKGGQFSVPVDYDLGQFIGLMVGDGWADDVNKISGATFHLADVDKCNAEWALSYVQKMAPTIRISERYYPASPGRYGETIRHSFRGEGSKVIAASVKKLVGGEGDKRTTGSANKRFPEWFSSAPADFLKGLLNGYLATDGAASISYVDGPPQLMLSYTSTSLRLIRETKQILNRLGVYCSITFAKTTCRGNDSWILTVSTPPAKEINLYANCCNERKAKIFRDAVVSNAPTSLKNNYIPFPECVFNAINPAIPCPKVSDAFRKAHEGEFTDEQWKARKYEANVAVAMYKAHDEMRATPYRAAQWLERIKKKDDEAQAAYAAGLLMTQQIEFSRDKHGAMVAEFSNEQAEVLKSAVDSVAPKGHPKRKTRPIVNALQNTNNAARKGRVALSVITQLRALLESETPYLFMNEPVVKQWANICKSNVRWVQIESIDYTDKEEVGYDLTVPGHETFMNTDGVILSNTINVHVPASDAASKEVAEKLLPSHQPFMGRVEDTVIHTPKQEEILGLYTAATAPATKPIEFNSREDAMKAIRQGNVKLSDDITYPGMEDDVGYVKS